MSDLIETDDFDLGFDFQEMLMPMFMLITLISMASLIQTQSSNNGAGATVWQTTF